MIYGYWLMEICIPSISHPKTLKSNIYFLAQRNPAGVFHWMLQDGLQSLRGMSDGNDMLSAQAYSPYGEPMFTDMPTEFGFTGEQTDPLNDLVYLRARYLNPKLGIFGSLDPFEGETSEPLTMNGYSWVEGNVVNRIDPRGKDSCKDISYGTGKYTFECQNPLSVRCLFSPYGGSGTFGSLNGFGGGDFSPEDIEILGKTFLAVGGVALATVLAPASLLLTAGSGIIGSGFNFTEQMNNLRSLPENTGEDIIDLMKKINYGEVFLTGTYASAITGLAVATGGSSLYGSAAGLGGYLAGLAETRSKPRTEDVFSNMLWGGVTWEVSGALTRSYGLDLIPRTQRLIEGSVVYWAVGASTYVFQTTLDVFVTGSTPPQPFGPYVGPLGQAALYGLTNITSALINPYAGAFLGALANSIYSVNSN